MHTVSLYGERVLLLSFLVAVNMSIVNFMSSRNCFFFNIVESFQIPKIKIKHLFNDSLQILLNGSVNTVTKLSGF